MTSASPILVVGATGRHGGTGATVVRLLREQGIVVRALVRQADARMAPLRAAGVELALGDLHDRRSLKEALAGVEAAYFTYPIAAGVVDAAANFAAAGREAGLKRVVVMSMGAAHPEHPSALGRAQWLAEELLGWAGFACTHLRIAALFFENLPLLHGADIAGDGVLRNAFADVAIPWIAGEDAGRLAIAALLHPERFGGKTAVYATGGHSHSHAEIARILGAHLGRSLRHETIAREAWRARIAARAAADARISDDMAAHIAAVAASIRKALPLNDLHATTTGPAPLSLQQMLESGRLAFGESG
jgi:uncharacterized protein YbjT (DUF2867 family)